MSRRGAVIRCEMHVGQADGTYRPYDDLSNAEKDALAQKLTDRMAKCFNDYASTHPNDAGLLELFGAKK